MSNSETTAKTARPSRRVRPNIPADVELPRRGGFSEDFWGLSPIQNYLTQENWPWFGYVGAHTRTAEHDRLVEQLLGGSSAGAEFVVSEFGRGLADRLSVLTDAQQVLDTAAYWCIGVRLSYSVGSAAYVAEAKRRGIPTPSKSRAKSMSITADSGPPETLTQAIGAAYFALTTARREIEALPVSDLQRLMSERVDDQLEQLKLLQEDAKSL